MTTFACDVSYYQNPVDDSYPHHWLIFRACDGTFRDPNFAENLAWSKKAVASGKLAGYTIYCVYRPGVNTFEVVADMLGKLDKHVTILIDVESWGGQIRGDHSADITGLANRFATLLGDRRRVIVYANSGDYANLYPTRPSWLRLIVASYGSVQPSMHNLIGWQYSDGENRWPVPAGYPRSSNPFGPCDHNVFPGLTPAQLATSLGVGVPPAAKPAAAVSTDLLEWIMSLPGAPKGLTYQQFTKDVADAVFAHVVPLTHGAKPARFDTVLDVAHWRQGSLRGITAQIAKLVKKVGA